MRWAERGGQAIAYDETLAARVRDVLGDPDDMSARKMFGGISFMLAGNMSCGVMGDELMVRISPAEADALLAEPHVRQGDMSGRPMKGWLVVGAARVADDGALARWVERGVAFAASLPAKG